MEIILLVGREKEREIIEKAIDSKRPEFLSVYGRRRVGKTFLIQNTIVNRGVILECSGMKDGSLSEQLQNFNKAFCSVFYPGIPLETPKSWHEAFERLTNEAKKIPEAKKIIVFFDELPWLASPKSKLMQSIDYFWNTEWSKLNNFKFIVCGSAASWMLDHLVNAKGGLYNRLTKTIKLDPFNLSETKHFLSANKIKLTNSQVLEVYMVMGGVAFYLMQMDKSKSVTQNINDICFNEDGLLFNEFPRLFQSLFDNSALNLKIVKEIAKKHYGISFAELIDKVGKKAGGRFQEKLKELEAAGFIRSFIPYGKTKRDRYYRVIDPYTLFYLKWIVEVSDGNKLTKNSNYWLKISQSVLWSSWAGYAFEVVCFLNADKIIEALDLDKIGCLVSGWSYKPKTGTREKGAQIDMLLDRSDNAVTICEIKYSNDKISFNKDLARNLADKLETFTRHTKGNKQTFLALITTCGLKKNVWSEDLINQVITLEDAF